MSMKSDYRIYICLYSIYRCSPGLLAPAAQVGDVYLQVEATEPTGLGLVSVRALDSTWSYDVKMWKNVNTLQKW